MFPLNRPFEGWEGKRLWIVGASSGIGASLASQALAAGAKVALSARRTDRLAALAGGNPNALAVSFDAIEEQSWKEAYAEIQTRFGGVDLVIFCAAEYRPERSWEVTPAGSKRTLSINLGSLYCGLATILPAMLERGSGGIAIIASVAGWIGLPNASVYGPSKAALINLAEILYSDLHPKGLDVYLINPGFVNTQLTARNDFHMPAMLSPDEAASAIMRGVAAGRFEIHFPWRFTLLVKLVRMLPYRLRFALIGQLVKS
ncbi:SDR family NAD(P)-dependent oxidoreductase [Pseudoduganella violaceinigra]|uniref:SDR family NAD(P)-dependent oxidoreductase n=1 Tax=Pseudoduganella violaceinigra TaxID=246602 RepID=UPI000424183F|nr:SDR family NAD(P)-dependent oxidoreductase [Pseudoduganella violaceinigra]